VPSPEEYRQRLTSMSLRFSGSTIAEAEAALARCRELQGELRHMKSSVNLDIKGIRASYQHRMSSPAPIASTVFSLFGKRKLAGSIRADTRRALRIDLDKSIAPYEQVKMMIDDLLLQLDGARRQITQFIQQNKTSQRVPGSSRTQNAGVYCSSCGASMGLSDRFCPQCGTHRTPSEVAGPCDTKSTWEEQARELMRRGKKIHAIKLVRESTTLGLKEAKDLVESWE
jgi:uncharacterized OB-fold protein